MAGAPPAAPDALVRVTARLCHLLRDANRLSWFAPRVRAQVEGLREEFNALVSEGTWSIEISGNGLRSGDARFDDPPKAVQQLIGMFRRKQLTGMRLHPGVNAFEIVVLCQILQSRTAMIESTDREQLSHVELIERGAVTKEFGVVTVPRPSRASKILSNAPGADREVRDLVAEITGAIDSLGSNGSDDEKPARGKSRAAPGLLELVDQLGKNAEIALILSSLRRHDEYTYDHSINVGLLSICLARHIGWSGRDLFEFGIAALIHDVGKLYTPLEVLNKPGRLSPPEWVVMKRHPRDGFDILREGGVGSPMAPNIALEHHIGPDGVGYPPLPYGPDRIHPGSQIVRIADIYDAFTTIRPYRSQARPQEVLKMLRKQAGRQLHGEFVEAFCEMMGEWPIGATVRLRSGLLGIVVDVHPESPARPLVRVLRDEQNRDARKLRLVDLREKDAATGEYVDHVEESIDPVIRNINVGRYI